MPASTQRLICSTAPFFNRPLKTAFARIAEAGFTGVEVMVAKDPATQDPGLLMGASREFGLEVMAIHAPFLIFTRGVFGADPVGKVRQTIALARQTGTPVVVAHPPYRWQKRYAHFMESELAAESSEAGVVVGVENMCPLKGLDLHSAHRLEDLSRFPSVTLDTSHAAVAGLDLSTALPVLASRLAHVHLSGNSGKGWDSHLPPDEGVLPLARFLDALAAHDYRGAVSLELDLRRYHRDPAALVEVLRRSRDFCLNRVPVLI